LTLHRQKLWGGFFPHASPIDLELHKNVTKVDTYSTIEKGSQPCQSSALTLASPILPSGVTRRTPDYHSQRRRHQPRRQGHFQATLHWPRLLDL